MHIDNYNLTLTKQLDWVLPTDVEAKIDFWFDVNWKLCKYYIILYKLLGKNSQCQAARASHREACWIGALWNRKDGFEKKAGFSCLARSPCHSEVCPVRDYSAPVVPRQEKISGAAIDRTAPFSMTLNDPYPQFQGHALLWRWISHKRYDIQT